jgi:hypothetical protein
VRAFGVDDREHLVSDAEDEVAAPLDVFGDAGKRPADVAHDVDVHLR